MEESVQGLEDVVITGYAPFRKETFTGSAVTMNSDAILNISNTDVLSIISVLEPSFKLEENILSGSNPNRLPDYTVRGRSSLDVNDFDGNPNAPLVILDGFEVPLEKIYDLDINRMESVTLLKDASATAIYGSRAANGILVISTKQPEAGKLQLSITSNTFISTPDLNSYDLLNAEEKLELEIAAGLFLSPGEDLFSKVTQADLDNRKIWLTNNVKRGVDTYWLSQPVETSVDQQLSLFLQGGNDFIRYGVDANYKTSNGVMKGSGRDVYTLGFNFSYVNKNLKFKNYLSVDHSDQTNSIYGSFADYALANPYYEFLDQKGDPLEFLERAGISGDEQTRNAFNPLYNASLNSNDTRKYTNILEQFTVDWDVTDFFRWSTNASLISRAIEASAFTSPLHTSFFNTDIEERGSYTSKSDRSFDWNIRTTGSFNKDFSGHNLTANVGTELLEYNLTYEGFSANGFPNDVLTDVSFATQFPEGSKPIGEQVTRRTVGFFSNLNYAFNNRYFVDVSFRTDGSSAFGSNNQFASFWSAGAGWNVHRESFLSSIDLINQLKLRASIGTTGTTQFSPSQSLQTYQYLTDRRYRDGIIGAALINIGNEDLAWQSQFKRNIGADMVLWNNRINLVVDYYNETTTNLLTDLTIAPSTGFNSYKENLGEVLNKGFEVKLSGVVFKTEDIKVNLFVNAARNQSEISAISDALRTFNESQNELNAEDIPEVNRPLTRYAEGQSYTAIWGVPSLGIDPASGQEIFVKQNGELTFDWDSQDMAIIGDTEPDLFGFFGTNARWKNLELQASFRFSVGGQQFNQTLLDRIENANILSNTDSRVLTSRWQEPGDVAAYKDIADNRITKVSSRFVQDENLVQLSNLTIGYNFNDTVLDKLGMSRLKVSLIANDVFYASTIRQERGIDYPFARTFSLGIQANF